MNRAASLGIAAGVLGACWLVGRWLVAQQADSQDGQDGQDSPDSAPGVADSITESVMSITRNILGSWRPPAQYADAIAQAEDAYGIPRDVLARLLYQESHYRADIISGATRSPVGALGIAQFMPATAAQFGIDPLDALASIDAAGRYLSRLYSQFGTWALALAAYNWGPGNVQRKGLAAAPQETQRYYSQILADVNAANSTNYA